MLSRSHAVGVGVGVVACVSACSPGGAPSSPGSSDRSININRRVSIVGDRRGGHVDELGAGFKDGICLVGTAKFASQEVQQLSN
jgi:hypothetical protein